MDNKSRDKAKPFEVEIIFLFKESKATKEFNEEIKLTTKPPINRSINYT